MHGDVTRSEIYKSLNSIEKQTQPYQKPCQYKNNSYLRTSYYGKNKLFEYSEIHGFNRAKGLLNREDVINPFFDPTEDTWGEPVNIEGYEGSLFPPALAMNDKKKTFEEIQSEDKQERAEKIIEDNKDTVFPSYYKIWNDFVSRPLIYQASGLVETETDLGRKYVHVNLYQLI